MSGAERRLKQLTLQLASSSGVSSNEDVPSLLHAYITHDFLELRQQMIEFMKEELYQPNHYHSLWEQREITMQRLKKFMDQRYFSIEDYVKEPRRFMAVLEALAYVDYSLCIKMGVHATLCGGTICKLGTDEQRKEYIPRMDNLTLPGCFGMTELGHGSNVLGIQTTATYDPQRQEFDIHTPEDSASKFWIGGAAQHGKVCTVFAQLYVRGKWEGPHVFVVRIRDDQGHVMPGVTIRDCGAKMGLNGVDNGQLWFHHVRVPKSAMLARFASIDDGGHYHSPVADIPRRFGTMMGGLTTGRMLIAQSAIDALKIGLTIAIQFAVHRPQFGDKPILEYITHQRRLMPGLALTYAYHFAMKDLKQIALGGGPVDSKAVHVASSALKAAATWKRVAVLQHCRECCGGMGFLSANRIGPMLNDMNVDVTFEGDNTVLMQQAAKGIPEEVAGEHGRLVVQGADPRSSRGTLDILRALRVALGRQLSAAMHAGSGSQQDRFDANLDLAIKVGWAQVAVQALSAFLKAVQEAPAATKSLLELACDLYAASVLEELSMEVVQAGVVPLEALAGLREMVNRLCGQMAANDGAAALTLCQAFKLPKHVVQAPIAYNWRAM